MVENQPLWPAKEAVSVCCQIDAGIRKHDHADAVALVIKAPGGQEPKGPRGVGEEAAPKPKRKRFKESSIFFDIPGACFSLPVGDSAHLQNRGSFFTAHFLKACRGTRFFAACR